MESATLLKTATAQAEDYLVSTATEVEALSEDKAFSQVANLLEEAGSNDFRLGGILSLINRNGWLGGYSSFQGLVEDRFGMNYRKGLYLMKMYDHLVSNEIPWDRVSHLGWTKLKDLAKVLTLDNLDYWVPIAEKSTVLQLLEHIKASKNGGATDKTKTTSDVTTMTFKVHPDQKEIIRTALDDVKAKVNTEFDTVALQNLCTGYLSGSVAHDVGESEPSKTLPELMAEHGWQEVLGHFEQLFPKIDVTLKI